MDEDYLRDAAAAGSVSDVAPIVEELGADCVNHADPLDGFTALMQAAAFGNEEVRH